MLIQVRFVFCHIDEADLVLDHDSEGTTTRNTIADADESNLNFAAVLELEADSNGQLFIHCLRSI